MDIGYLGIKEIEDDKSYLKKLIISFLAPSLVMMRSRVQSSLAAPLKLNIIIFVLGHHFNFC